MGREIADLIREQNIDSSENRKGHVQSIKQEKKNQEAIDSRVCPRCGGELVERKGKYGTFYRCSNYPRCKYTKQCS